MRVAGRYRVVRHRDHAVPEPMPRPLLGRDAPVDIRVWSTTAELPLLLVTASRRQGCAVERNRFRRRVRMAFLEVLRDAPERCPMGCTVWVRPPKGKPGACQVSYQEIEGQLRLALSRWKPR